MLAELPAAANLITMLLAAAAESRIECFSQLHRKNRVGWGFLESVLYQGDKAAIDRNGGLADLEFWLSFLSCAIKLPWNQPIRWFVARFVKIVFRIGYLWPGFHRLAQYSCRSFR